MSSSVKLHPISAAFLSTLPKIDFSTVSVEDLRQPDQILDVPSPDVTIERIQIPCRTDNHLIQVDVYRPASINADEVLPAVVFLHGGGFCLEGQGAHPFLVSKIAAEAHCAVFYVYYSLSPEVKYPVAVEECYSVVERVTTAQHAKLLRVDPTRVAVGGDSAGACFTISITLLEKRRHLENKIKFQILYYPVTDYIGSSESRQLFGKGYLLESDLMKLYWGSYLRDENDQHDMIALCSNASVQDLIGLPPALVITAEADPLRDEGEAFVRQLMEAQVPVTSFRVQGVLHGFMSLTSLHSTESLQVIDITTATLRRLFKQK
ncbi:alpha/beta hydrolase fold-domain-containing protein [Mucor mucedo]|uniref:alpha/beta hydrolase fold-domain-containing protein n=1 Tax=Mucor mucedo TaxID=29922 RepID=UPI0022205822|nr:alpha/beta hydrolase fold-domain-containing protein [Mucor mucedo]KAI7886851.1 alpha/beta hydrolase fold-domain-containing protein [Mucor mucedo]